MTVAYDVTDRPSMISRLGWFLVAWARANDDPKRVNSAAPTDANRAVVIFGRIQSSSRSASLQDSRTARGLIDARSDQWCFRGNSLDPVGGRRRSSRSGW